MSKLYQLTKELNEAILEKEERINHELFEFETDFGSEYMTYFDQTIFITTANKQTREELLEYLEFYLQDTIIQYEDILEIVKKLKTKTEK